jgi:hypothetical protein
MADKSIGQYNETVSTDNNDEYLIQRTGKYFKIKYSNFVPPAPDLSNLFENGGNSFGENAFIGTTDNYTLSFKTNGNTVANLGTGGNFGLGVTAASGTRFHVKGSGNTSGSTALRVDSSTVESMFFVRDDGQVNSKNGYWIGDHRIVWNDANYNLRLGRGQTNTITGFDNITLGINSGAALSTGNRNFFAIEGAGGSMSSGDHNIAIGNGALQNNNNSSNIALGQSAMGNNTGIGSVAIGGGCMVNSGAASYSVAMGVNAGNAATGGGGVYLGVNAGQFETLANKIHIDTSSGRGNAAAARQLSLIYGECAGAAADQKLFVNGRLINKAIDSAIADGDLRASEMSAYIDETANTLIFKVKYADGTTVKTGSIALS